MEALSVLFFLNAAYCKYAKNIQFFDYVNEYKSHNMVFEGSRDRLPCNGLTPRFRQKIPSKNRSILFKNKTEKIMCPFRSSYLSCRNRRLQISDACLSDEWFCQIPSRQLCDGVSICLIDECNCPISNKTLFFCADGQGCVDLKMTCNGRYDCLDGSDELLCDDVIEIPCQHGDNFISEKTNSTLNFSKYLICNQFLFYNTNTNRRCKL